MPVGAGLRVAYLGHEVTEIEFNARAANLARIRGDAVNDELRSALARVRYLDLVGVVARAWEQPAEWVSGVVARFDVVVVDPSSAVESALGLNFEQRNTEFIEFDDALVQPLTARRVTVIMVDNVGHATDAQRRAKGVSGEVDRADLTLYCVPTKAGMVIRAEKVRSVRAQVRRGDEWSFGRDDQTITRHASSGDRDDDDAGFRPTGLMEKVSRYVEANPDATTNTIRSGVAGKDGWKLAALNLLISEGFIERRQRAQSKLHRSVRPYRESDDLAEPVPEPVPKPATRP